MLKCKFRFQEESITQSSNNRRNLNSDEMDPGDWSKSAILSCSYIENWRTGVSTLTTMVLKTSFPCCSEDFRTFGTSHRPKPAWFPLGTRLYQSSVQSSADPRTSWPFPTTPVVYFVDFNAAFHSIHWGSDGFPLKLFRLVQSFEVDETNHYGSLETAMMLEGPPKTKYLVGTASPRTEHT